ncbi:hypothetical protein BKA66DRAFT_325945 [Pyrenochaeta sp. MPI-SDFR-AT-0127]|nr:hypothetical protein BKA66DRAFT_325945 [Pyrenochaeta sp. MPI-SDFR-AT-0127]
MSSPSPVTTLNQSHILNALSPQSAGQSAGNDQLTSIQRQSSTVSRTLLNPGTSAVEFIPYLEQIATRENDSYQSISAQKEYLNFSVEELRVADYDHGRGCPPPELDTASFVANSVAPSNKIINSSDKRSVAHLDLLRGSGFEVCVGTSTPLHTATDRYSTWSLPRGLISHYSPFLKAACSSDFKERQENRIVLADDNPLIFGLFVEWMYYGDYLVQLSPSSPDHPEEDISVEAQCWVLGDKLLCTAFKNVSMNRLFDQHNAMFGARVVTKRDARYVFDNSATNSKLRKFYMALVIQHFADPNRLKGSTEDWDELLLDHADVRLSLLQSFRTAPEQRTRLGGRKDYMDQDEPLSKPLGEMKLECDDAQGAGS